MADKYPLERLDRSRAALVLVDHQAGLLLGVHDHDQEELRRNVIALTKIAKAYHLPAVITTSADDGPNGALLPEVAAELPDAVLVRRPGEIDAFDNGEFAAAVKATGRVLLEYSVGGLTWGFSCGHGVRPGIITGDLHPRLSDRPFRARAAGRAVPS